MPPVVVTVVGIAWMQAGAWRVNAVKAGGSFSARARSRFRSAPFWAFSFVFQVLLRPGVPFF